jgi:hypothetical protein
MLFEAKARVQALAILFDTGPALFSPLTLTLTPTLTLTLIHTLTLALSTTGFLKSTSRKILRNY